ncbi:hypothetical protein T08_9744 [Trichinella sp. T8]|nr:hypothetical protein T08_9744 [Trichinella sp. T8]
MHSYYFITVLFDKRWRCVTKVLVQDASGNRLDLIREEDKIFNLHLLMAFNFILNLAGRISLSA